MYSQFGKIKFKENTVITQTVTSQYHTISVDSEGNTWSWGSNFFCESGINITMQYDQFLKIVEPKFVRSTEYFGYSCGTSHCYLLDNNKLTGFGSTEYGQIADDNNNIKAATKVLCSRDTTLVLDSSGHLKSTGNNVDGVLGLGVDSSEVSYIYYFSDIYIKKKVVDFYFSGFRGFILTDNSLMTWGN